MIYFCRVLSKLACEAQTYFRSSFLSLRKIIIIFRRERSDDLKYVYASQARSKLKVTKVRKEEAFLLIRTLFNLKKVKWEWSVFSRGWGKGLFVSFAEGLGANLEKGVSV